MLVIYAFQSCCREWPTHSNPIGSLCHWTSSQQFLRAVWYDESRDFSMCVADHCDYEPCSLGLIGSPQRVYHEAITVQAAYLEDEHG